jgi:hypothetical protein
MKIKLCLPLIALVSLASCAYTTSSEVTSADRYLKGDCKEAYLSSRTSASSDGFGYQYHRYRVRAFAVANYGDTQVCSWWHAPWGTPQTQANLMAVNSCNQRLPQGLTCTVYAEDDRIVNAPPNYPIVAQVSPQHKLNEAMPSNPQSSSMTIEEAKKKCSGDFAIPVGTERFGKCVLQLTK